MNNLCRLLGTRRIAISLTRRSLYIQLVELKYYDSFPKGLVSGLDFAIARTMSQKSITSFFKATPKKSPDVKEAPQKEMSMNDSSSSAENNVSPVSNGKEKRISKRQRLESSDEESQSPKPAKRKSSPVGSETKKKSKRLRIESSESEAEPQTEQKLVKSEPNTPVKKDTKSPVKEDTMSDKDKPKSPVKDEPNTPLKDDSMSPVKDSSKTELKLEKSSPNTETTPKAKKSATKAKKEKKTPLLEKNTKSNKKGKEKVPDKKSVTEKGKKSPSPSKQEKTTVEKKVVSMNSFFKKENGVSETKDGKKGTGSKVAEEDYNPLKSKYHPVDDACWAKGEEVPYLGLAKTLEAIEATSARLKIVEILSNYFRSVIALTPEDLLPSVYMCLNQLAPAYHSLELGIAETYLMKAIAQCTGRTLAQVKSSVAKSGDLGLVAEQARSTQRTMFPAPPLKLRKVFAVLKEVAHMTGQASVNKKISKIQSLYIACRGPEARYLIRSLEGKLRIGLAEQSVLQALAQATVLTPPNDPDGTLDASKGLSPAQLKTKIDEQALLIKTTYCECPNYDLMIPALLKYGVAALPDHCKLTPGIPLKPMLAHPTKSLSEVFDRFEKQEFTCEWKYDGERAQIHVPGTDAADYGNAAVFSRNQENNTSKYPDILSRLPKLLKDDVTSCVLDTEAVAYDVDKKQILPFQILSTRKRKDALEEEIKVQVCVFVFDLLYLNGRALVKEPLATRRELLRKHFNEVEGEWQFATSKDCSSIEEVQQFLDEAIKGSCEGLMVKMLHGENARYDIARRSHNWLKLKKDYLDGIGDTIDAVVIGAYYGKGKRAGVYGGFLLACVDSSGEEYQTLCKIGTGFSDEDLKTLTAQLKEHVIEGPKNYYRYDNSHTPDVWLEPACVWEVRCADLSLSPAHRAAIGLVDPDKGISQRFPRFVRVREDKTPEQATTAQQIAEMYLSQDQVKNTGSKVANVDDFY